MATTGIKVLIVDDDVDLGAALTEYISKMGVSVRMATSLGEAQAALGNETPAFDLVLADLKIPGGSGMDVLRAARMRSSESLVTIITGYASMDTAIEAIRLGAYNYIAKPFSLSEIGVLIRNMIERITLSKENAHLSLRLQELYQQINRVQNERSEILSSYEEIKAQLKEATGKLDQLLGMYTRRANGAKQTVNGYQPAADF